MRTFIFFFLSLMSFSCFAQNVGIGTIIPATKLHVVDSNPLTTALTGENTFVGNTDGTGVFGKAVNLAGYGTGVMGEGGFSGLDGFGYGTNNASTTYGVYGRATGNALLGTRIGVYGLGVGGAINYGLYCDGNGVYTGTWTLVSDQKFKKNLVPVTGALGIIKQLNPVSYQLKKEEYPMMNFPSARQYGFVAQELEKVIPTLVENGIHPGATKEDKDIELKSVNYIGMIPILTKAIQEQQQMIEALKVEIEKLKAGK